MPTRTPAYVDLRALPSSIQELLAAAAEHALHLEDPAPAAAEHALHLEDPAPAAAAEHIPSMEALAPAAAEHALHLEDPAPAAAAEHILNMEAPARLTGAESAERFNSQGSSSSAGLISPSHMRSGLSLPGPARSKKVDSRISGIGEPDGEFSAFVRATYRRGR